MAFLCLATLLGYSQNISKDSINRFLIKTWREKEKEINSLCDSLQLGKPIRGFNGLKNGKYNYVQNGTEYDSDDFNYLFSGKVQSVKLLFREDKLVLRIYIFSSIADYVLASSGLMMRLKLLPADVGDIENPLFVIESSSYSIRERSLVSSNSAFIIIADKKYISSNKL